MLKFETSATMTADNTRARACDACRFSHSAAVYCRSDLAYLCSTCDARIHPAFSLHERVRVCECCERAPGAFLCKADSASLCAACDENIHSANPLARRHHRVPVQPIPIALYGHFAGETDNVDEDEAAIWLLLKNGEDEARPPSFAGELDEYLDLDDYNHFSEGYSCNNHQEQQQQHYGAAQSSYAGDSIVPIKYEKGNDHCFHPASISQTVSFSSMDVGVVPESASEASLSHTRPSKGTIDLFSSPVVQTPSQLSAIHREARVLRYWEKKKMRKFEKTIRYASRKAYAEKRPRIKGRFAKRRGPQAQLEVDHLLPSQSLMQDTTYGIVPTF